MEKLKENSHKTTRNLTYRYYASHPSQATPSTVPTLLLLHGFPDEATLWNGVVPYLLETNLRIIVPDLLGYGGTSKPTDPKDFEVRGMVNDVVEILKKEGVEGSVIPVGHDWGSYLAQRFYMLNKSLCLGLVTLSVALMPARTDPFNLAATNDYTEKVIGYPIYAYWELFTAPDGAKILEDHLESGWYVMHGDEDDWMRKMFCVRGAFRQYLLEDRKDVALKPYAQDDKMREDFIKGKKEGGFTSPLCWYHALAGDYQLETERSLDAKVEKPYLYIGCDQDAVCRTDSIETAKGAGLITGDLEVKVLHSNHWCPYEKPEEVGETIVKWLGKQGFVGGKANLA